MLFVAFIHFFVYDNYRSTQNDEMCNFYVMYYVDGDHMMKDSYCFSAGPPTYYWKDSEFAQDMNLENIPKTASVVPGTEKVLKVRN